MEKNILLRRATLMALIALGLAGCSTKDSNPYSSTSAAPMPSSPTNVAIAGMTFGPAQLTVAKNTTVSFTNNDGISHTATSDAGLWDTGTITPGATKTITFTSAGTFAYHCTIHPMMKASIVVQ